MFQWCCYICGSFLPVFNSSLTNANQRCSGKSRKIVCWLFPLLFTRFFRDEQIHESLFCSNYRSYVMKNEKTIKFRRSNVNYPQLHRRCRLAWRWNVSNLFAKRGETWATSYYYWYYLTPVSIVSGSNTICCDWFTNIFLNKEMKKITLTPMHKHRLKFECFVVKVELFPINITNTYTMAIDAARYNR